LCSRLVCVPSDRVVSRCCADGVARLFVAIERCRGLVVVVCRVVREIFGWWGVCTVLPELLSFAPESVLLLDLPLGLFLCAYALHVDLRGLLWGQP
jgi:hypothetical protein